MELDRFRRQAALYADDPDRLRKLRGRARHDTDLTGEQRRGLIDQLASRINEIHLRRELVGELDRRLHDEFGGNARGLYVFVGESAYDEALREIADERDEPDRSRAHAALNEEARERLVQDQGDWLRTTPEETAEFLRTGVFPRELAADGRIVDARSPGEAATP